MKETLNEKTTSEIEKKSHECHDENCHCHEHHNEHHHEEHSGISCSCCHDDDDDEEEMSLTKIIISSGIFIFAIIASHLPIINELKQTTFLVSMGTSIVEILLMLMFFMAFIIVGLPVIKNAVRNIFKGNVFDEQFLMSLASVGAVCLGEFSEAVAVMLLYQIGEYFQDYAVDKSKDSISELMKLRPDSATVIRNGNEVIVAPEEITIGETILVKPGERIPLDGTISKGKSFVDTSAQTGESVPREVYEGNSVMAGFINMQGVIEITVKKSFSESSVSRILELVQNATQNKAQSERFITKFARVYTPIVCLAALIVAFIPPLVLQQDFTQWISRALNFLIVSCPCALVISVPLSFFGGIGSSSRKGILIKGSNYIEALSKVKTAVFDKTGTLTKGTFVVTAIHPAKKLNLSKDELIALATHAEFYSTHPISKSLKTAHHCELCGNLVLKDAQEISGQGLKVTIEGQQLLVGNEKLLENNNVTDFLPCSEVDNGTIVHLAVDGKYAGHIVISDEIKEDAKQAISDLKKIGIRHTFMLTGDKTDVAQNTASSLGIETSYAELLPEEKLNKLEEILSNNKNKKDSVMYIGDGINDAPVLARADVGIAMGALGSDAAIEAADVVIMSGEMSKLQEAIMIAKKTVRIVRQNIVFALTVKIAIMIASTFGFANIWMAVFGDVGVAFLAVLNALRLLKI